MILRKTKQKTAQTLFANDPKCIVGIIAGADPFQADRHIIPSFQIPLLKKKYQIKNDFRQNLSTIHSQIFVLRDQGKLFIGTMPLLYLPHPLNSLLLLLHSRSLLPLPPLPAPFVPNHMQFTDQEHLFALICKIQRNILPIEAKAEDYCDGN